MHESWVVVFITGSVGMSEQSFTTVGENCRVESEVPRWAHLSRNLTLLAKATSLPLLAGGRSSAWLEPQIVDLVVAGSNPVGHPISCPVQSLSSSSDTSSRWRFCISANLTSHEYLRLIE